MVSKHTPGDWYVRNKGAVTVCTDISEKTHVLATINEFAPGDADANARLICAAPNLLSALQAIMKKEAISDDDLYNDAALAIRKAIGEYP